jgi:Spy/CpxP family protein refolding chaperone
MSNAMTHRRIHLATIAAVALAAAPTSAGAASPPIYNSVRLNIGLNCQWQQRCMEQQERAMKRALDFVRKARPASWRIHQCNRNASRSRYRVDWVGFDNCIRNASLRASSPRPFAKRRRPTA